MKRIKLLSVINILLSILMLIAMWFVNNSRSYGLAAFVNVAIFLLYFITFVVVASILGIMLLTLLLICAYKRKHKNTSDRGYKITATVWTILLSLAGIGTMIVLIWGTVLCS